MSEAHPHSTVWWFFIENHERNSNGDLAPGAIERKKAQGVFHFTNKKEASASLEKIFNAVKEIMENAKSEDL